MVILSSRKVKEILYSHWFFGLFFLAEEELKTGDKSNKKETKTYDVFIIYDDESEEDKELVHIKQTTALQHYRRIFRPKNIPRKENCIWLYICNLLAPKKGPNHQNCPRIKIFVHKSLATVSENCE